MTAAVRIALTETAIKRHQTQTARELRDPRHPLVLRYHASRERGSWYLVSSQSGVKRWRKIGNWPALSARLVLDRLPDLLADLALNPNQDATVAAWDTLGPLLAWNSDRTGRTSALSEDRRRGVESVTRRHLIPLLGSCRLSALNRAVIDRDLILPLQETHSLSTVRLVFSTLKSATATARRLHMIGTDPLAELAAIEPCRAADRMLVLLMLLHGTRLGETRRAQWDHIDLKGGSWHIPQGHTKTRQEHQLPLTDQAVDLLTRYQQAQKSRGYKGSHLFPGPNRGAITAQRASDTIRVISEGNWSAHDLRKLARTCWADLGVDYMVGELLLNHALSRMDKTYIHTYAAAQCRDALARYHGWLVDKDVIE